MWAQIQTLQLVRKCQPRCIRPSPFQRDVGGASSLDGGTGEGETQGVTQGMGGPFDASPQRTTMKIVVRFLPFISPRSALTTLSPHAAPTTHVSTASHCTNNPTTKARQTTTIPPNDNDTATTTLPLDNDTAMTTVPPNDDQNTPQRRECNPRRCPRNHYPS